MSSRDKYTKELKPTKSKIKRVYSEYPELNTLLGELKGSL